MLKKAFTLIELLVVIAIIAILASMLVPGLGRAEEASEYTTCLTGMKTHGLGVVWYSNEWGDFLPINGGGNVISSRDPDQAVQEAVWDSQPTRQGPFFGIKPPSAGPGCWPPNVNQTGMMCSMGQWPNKIYKYDPVQETAACPRGKGTWKDCSDCSGFTCNLGVWGLVGFIGTVEWNHGYSESFGHNYWKDGPWGFGNGRDGGTASAVNLSQCTHLGDSVFAGHTAGNRHYPSFCGNWPIYMHPVYGATRKHFTETGTVYNFRDVANGGEWPRQDNRILDGISGKHPYLMGDSSVRGFELKPLCWDATRYFLAIRAADDLEHSWPP
jgi:prepilin-type N-terminal cleavage/methylation domain-containing protein